MQRKISMPIRLDRYGRVVLFFLLVVFGPISASSQADRNPQGKPAEKQPGGQGKEQPKPGTGSQRPASPVQGESESFKISSNLVAVPVSVTNAAGEPVQNLRAEDFQLEEEGKSQQIFALGEPGKTPVEIALLFDVSVSVHGKFEFEQQAAARFLKEVLKPKDAVSIFTIGFQPKLIQARNENVSNAVNAVLGIRPTKDATAFFDSIAEASQYLAKSAQPGARRAIVVISDGEDTLSEKYKGPDAQRELQRADCLFYSINPSGPSIRLNRISIRGQEGMESLASVTGGVAFLPDRFEDLDTVFRQITAELQAQYMLGYYSPDEKFDGGFRKITVRVNKRPELRVRSRQGYYAPKS